MLSTGPGGPLAFFRNTTILGNAKQLQSTLVPWLISRFGVTDKRDGSYVIVRHGAMIVAMD